MNLGYQVRLTAHALLNIFYPETCQICHQDLMMNEQHVCLNCSYDLPYIGTDSHALHQLNQLFWNRVEVEKVFSLLNYQKGNVAQTVLHRLKYESKTKMGTYFGKALGEQIGSGFHVDAILPVPLHPKKLRARGFNQSECIANGVAKVINAPVKNNWLVRNAYNASQTKFSKYDRWENVRQIFSVRKKSLLEGKHVLLVDDVLTTGATVEACVKELQTVNNCKVSIATLAARI